MPTFLLPLLSSLAAGPALAANPAAPVAPAPLVAAPAVLVEAVGALSAGTVVVPIPASPAPEEPPAEQAVRVGTTLHTVPAHAVAVPDKGAPLVADLDGDGRPDRAWLATARFPAPGEDEEAVLYRNRYRTYVVAEVGGRVLVSPYREAGSCSGEMLVALDVGDATGDGRTDLVVTTEAYICEAGTHESGLLVLGPRGDALVALGEVTVPRWPLVSTFATGRIAWRPGEVETVVIHAGCGERCLVRMVTPHTWRDGALRAGGPSAGRVVARVRGLAAVVERVSYDAARVRIVDAVEELPLDAVTFVDPFVGAALAGTDYAAVVRAP